VSDTVSLDPSFAVRLAHAVTIHLPFSLLLGLADPVTVRVPLTFVGPFSLGEPEPGCLTDAKRAGAAWGLADSSPRQEAPACRGPSSPP
jgi:hypothetical protein